MTKLYLPRQGWSSRDCSDFCEKLRRKNLFGESRIWTHRQLAGLHFGCRRVSECVGADSSGALSSDAAVLSSSDRTWIAGAILMWETQ